MWDQFWSSFFRYLSAKIPEIQQMALKNWFLKQREECLGTLSDGFINQSHAFEIKSLAD